MTAAVHVQLQLERANAALRAPEATLQVIYGLQFAVDHQSQFNIRVVNLRVAK